MADELRISPGEAQPRVDVGRAIIPDVLAPAACDRHQGDRADALLGGLDGRLEVGLPTEPKRAKRGRRLAEVYPNGGQPLAGQTSGRVRPGAA